MNDAIGRKHRWEWALCGLDGCLEPERSQDRNRAFLSLG